MLSRIPYLVKVTTVKKYINMSSSMSKFTTVGRHKFESSLVEIFGDISTAQYCLSKLRPKVRTFLLKIAGGESIHHKIVRMQMGVFIKSAF